MKEVTELTKRAKRLFMPENSDDNIRVINGETTNLLNLENVKYQWAHDIFDRIFANNWLPHKTPMGDDKTNWKTLSADEQEAYKNIISFLEFLDSIQTNNLPNISNYITSPDIVYVLARQTFDEAVHSKSYGWILSSIFSHKEASEIVYKWRENTLLLERNEFIAGMYEEFITKEQTPESFIKVCIANYLLEGLYFYNGFYFFHNLASRGLMMNTDTQIRYIQRDEIQHCDIFKNIILETFKENPGLKERTEEMIYDLFRTAVEWEIKFSTDIIGDKILGMTSESIIDYTNYLGNKRLRDIGLKHIFEKGKKNPYAHLDMIAGVEDETSVRSNNFEVNSITYKQPTILSGWDEI